MLSYMITINTAYPIVTLLTNEVTIKQRLLSRYIIFVNIIVLFSDCLRCIVF